MLTLILVKNTLIVPIYIILFFVLVFILLTTLNLVAEITLNHPASFEPNNNFILNYLPQCMLQVFPFALIISTNLWFFRELVKPGNQYLSFLLLLITLFVFFLFGTKLLTLLPHEGPKRKNIEYFLSEKKTTVLNNFSVYTDKIEGNRLYNLFIHKNTIEGPQLNFYNEALTNIKEDNLKFSLLSSKMENINTKATPIGNSFFNTPQTLKKIIGSFIFFSNYLKLDIEKFDLYSILFALSLAFFLTGSSLFIRISRWPFFNFILYFAFIVFIFPGFHFFVIQLLPELSFMIKNSQSQRILVIIIFGTIGVLSNFINFLFIPYDRWKKDFEND